MSQGISGIHTLKAVSCWPSLRQVVKTGAAARDKEVAAIVVEE
jgi:hypothetical protein